MEILCNRITRRYVNGNDKFWQNAFYATIVEQNKMLQNKVIDVLGADTSQIDSFVWSINLLHKESQRRADESQKPEGELILNLRYQETSISKSIQSCNRSSTSLFAATRISICVGGHYTCGECF